MPPRPRLDPALVADDTKLAAVVDDAIHHDPDASAVQVEILRLQHELRELVDADAWGTYLSVEEQVTARWSELAVALVRWAYGEGVKTSGRTP